MRGNEIHPKIYSESRTLFHDLDLLLTGNRPWVAFVFVVVRRRLSPKALLADSEFRRQRIIIANIARLSRNTIDKWFDAQTTYHGTKFFQTSSFLRAAAHANTIEGDLIVANAAQLLTSLDTNKPEAVFQQLRTTYPRLWSAAHRIKIANEKFNMSASLAVDEMELKRLLKIAGAKQSSKSSRSTSQIRRTALRGAASTKAKADMAATLLAPILSAIISSEPGISLTRIAEELNNQGRPAMRGGKWRSSSVRNLLNRCRRLGLLPEAA